VRWNAEYRARFGFPFIICVRRHTRASIFAEFSRRLAGQPETDTARGRPVAGVEVELFMLADDGSARLVAASVTGADGRTETPLIDAQPVPIGTYEARFSLGSYLSDRAAERLPFLDVVPIRFTVTEPEAHYHIPLLFTPWGYTTYRGS
jgi:2-oxo-4-hydroxy-4-carboxy-5-ureidoimidazoline decarboxylase